MRCRWCKKEVAKDKYMEHLSECKKYQKWLARMLEAV